MEENKEKSFLEFCKENIIYILIVFFATIGIYGAWAFQYFITFDAEGFYLNTSRLNINAWYMQWISLGRWAFVVLKKILGVVSINPFFSIGIFIVLFPLSAILWNYLFKSWGLKTKKFTGEVIFPLIYISSPVWALQFAYRNQIEVLSVIAVILPIAIYYFTKYVDTLCNRNATEKVEKINYLYIILSMLAIVFCFAGYQSFMIMYVLSIVIYFFINIMNGKLTLKDFYKKLLILVILSIIMLGVYYFSAYFFNMITGTKMASSYVTSQCMWIEKNFSECVDSLSKSLSTIFLGDNIAYTCILIAEFLLGIPMLIIQIKRNNNLGLKIWSVLVYLAMFVIALALTIITAGQAVHRQQLPYILLVAFLASFEVNYYLENIKLLEKIGILYGIICLIISYTVIIQFEMNTRLLYSDYFTMKNDYLEMEEIYNRAREKGAKGGEAIAFAGGRSNKNTEPIYEYEVIGFSYLEVTSLDATKMIEAMIGYGFDVTKPNAQQIMYAKDRSVDMESYPAEGSIVVEDGLIVVKLSD